jgi:hypothetical protein
MTSSDIKFIACASLALLLIGLASSMDYNDKITGRGDYCDMVKNGDWPDAESVISAYCL